MSTDDSTDAPRVDRPDTLSADAPSADADETAQDRASQDVPERDGRSGWSRGQVVVTTMLTLALVASLVSVGLLWRQRERTEDLATAGRQGEAAARSAVVSMTSYDHETVDEDFAWVDDAGTADFATYFKGVSAPSVALIKQLQANARGAVVDSAVRVDDIDHVTVLLFVDQKITTDVQTPVPAAPSVDQPRVTMSMVRGDTSWLVDSVDINNADDPTQG